MGLMPLPKAVRPIELDLAPGDVLVLATDGIFEYEDAAAVAYGRARLEAVVREHRHAPIAALSGQLLASVAAFAKGAPQLDDMTTVLLRRQAA
jgi:serine phosphatase RsbU (regulator of sigma subunit)